MYSYTTLCEIREQGRSVMVDGIIINSRAGKTLSEGSKKAFNFVIRDVIGDTANVVYWHPPGDTRTVEETLRIGSAWRFSLKSIPHWYRSQTLDPRTTTPCVLQLESWPVEEVSPRIERRLTEILHSPPEKLVTTPIPELLSAAMSEHKSKINLLGVPVSIGEPREVALKDDGHTTALDMKVIDSSGKSIDVTVWGTDMTRFVKNETIVWHSVILFQDATLDCRSAKSNKVTMSTQALITPNLGGEELIMLQRKARPEWLKSEKLPWSLKNFASGSCNSLPKRKMAVRRTFLTEEVTLEKSHR